MTLKKSMIAAGLAIFATAASALTTLTMYHTDVVFYSDAAMTTAVGGRIIYCDGERETWGTTSIYKQTVKKFPCSTPYP